MLIHPELPIYYVDGLVVPVLYTPGTLAAVEKDDVDLIRQTWLSGEKQINNPRTQSLADWLIGHARQVVATRKKWLNEKFKPECLSVYLSNSCNLQCSYCFADTGRNRAFQVKGFRLPVINEDAFSAGALLVADNCRQKDLPFQLVLHGGGEPTIHWDLLYNLVNISRICAAEHDIDWQGYIATNGVMSLNKAKWLGQVFQRIGLSCDGPPDIQDRQRPLLGQRGTSQQVKQTARVFTAEGAQLDIRATITPETLTRQKEIVHYLVQEFSAERIRFEPVYSISARKRKQFIKEDPIRWATLFVEARKFAYSLGVDLDFSGIRLDEVHGPFCNVLRQTLHLTPKGKATSCFLCVDSDDRLFQEQIIGHFEQSSRLYQLDQKKITALRRKASQITGTCRHCFAAYHCSRSCPEYCVANDNASNTAATNSFGCQFNKAIGRLFIEDSVKDLIEESIPNISFVKKSVPNQIKKVIIAANHGAADAVIEQYNALRSNYPIETREMPKPPWEEKGFQYSGQQAWHELNEIITSSEVEPISIYVHIPFCDSRCDFCDCYSLKTIPNHRLHFEYTEKILKDMVCWANFSPLPTRPVTTIHFGGGTPMHLNKECFARIVESIASTFNVTDSTEWAIETTASLLKPNQLSILQELGFKRLHVGVQTLEEPLRKYIGRRETTRQVLERINECFNRGFITSIDMLYGLPGETPAGFFSDINQLTGIGVHGISFYRFNHSKRNQSFVKRYGRKNPDIFKDYAMFLVADYMMGEAGYRKNHFCHYATKQDLNLYYNHGRRGEDLLALGATADGVFKNFHYRYPLLSKSSMHLQGQMPLLQGGISETKEERLNNRIIAQIMTASIDREVMIDLGLSALLDQWIRHRLVQRSYRDIRYFNLTGNGSWFINSMILEVRH